MSSIVISGDTSGAVTVAVPAVAGTNTVTIAAQTGTLNAAGPAFSAYQSSGQTIGAATATKIQFQTEVFDTNNNYDNATNYRFTPTVAGYYQVTGGMYFGGGAQGTQIYIYKNGSLYLNNAYIVCNGATITGLVYFNGSTDYAEIWCYILAGYGLSATSSNTYFQASLVRGA